MTVVSYVVRFLHLRRSSRRWASVAYFLGFPVEQGAADSASIRKFNRPTRPWPVTFLPERVRASNTREAAYFHQIWSLYNLPLWLYGCEVNGQTDGWLHHIICPVGKGPHNIILITSQENQKKQWTNNNLSLKLARATNLVGTPIVFL